MQVDTANFANYVFLEFLHYASDHVINMKIYSDDNAIKAEEFVSV